MWQCSEQAFEFLFLHYVTLAFWKCQLSFGSSLNHHHYMHCLRLQAGHKFLFISPVLDLVLFTIEFMNIYEYFKNSNFKNKFKIPMTNVLIQLWRNWKLCTVGRCVKLWGTMEYSMEVPQKIKNKTTTWSSNLTSGYLSKRTEIRILKRY